MKIRQSHEYPGKTLQSSSSTRTNKTTFGYLSIPKDARVDEKELDNVDMYQSLAVEKRKINETRVRQLGNISNEQNVMVRLGT